MKKFLLLLALCASFGLMAQEAEVIKGILPSGLTSSVADNNATFKFYSNSAAESAQLIFYDATSGEQVGTYDLTGVVEGNNEFVVPCTDLPGTDGQQMNWAVKLVGKPITEYALINNPDDFNYTYTFNTVDNNPESDFFGRIYIGHRTTAGAAQRGLWIYNPDYSLVNQEVINTRSDEKTFSSNYRMAIDAEGKVYMPDWGDGTSGVFVFDPANPDAGFKEFFSNPDGTSLNRGASGVLINAEGDSIAGSTPGVGICGSGENTKLYVYNEDIIVNGSGNNVSVYNIGTATSWNQAPNATYAIGALEANTNGNVIPDEEHGGVWVAQYRGKGNNTNGVPSLIYVNAAGEVVYNSGSQNDILNGSNGAGFTFAPNGQLVISDGDTNISFYNVTWTDGVPSLSYVTQFTPDITNIARLNSGVRLIYQMNFDYAGNLILSGAKVGIYSIPTEENVTIVPAKKALIVEKVAPQPVVHTYTVAGTPASIFGAEWNTELEANDMTLNEETGRYEWTSAQVTLDAGANVQFKVAEDHAWTVSYGLNGGADNVSLTAEKAGTYTLSVYFDPQNNNNVTGELTLIEEIVTEYGEFYLVGTFSDPAWSQDEDARIPFTANDDGSEYSVTVNLAAGDQFKIITFVDDELIWIGAESDGNFVVLPGFYENHIAINLIFGEDGENFEMQEGGKYKITLMQGQEEESEGIAPKALQAPLVMIIDKPTGIETINSDKKVDNAWYNMNGIRFENKPTVPGIYIHNGQKMIIK